MIVKHIKKHLKENVYLYQKTLKEYFIIENNTLIHNAYSTGYITGKQARKLLHKYVYPFTENIHL